METSMENLYPFFAVALLVFLFVFLEIGRRLGLAKLKRGEDDLDKGNSTVETAIFAIFGLLLAFTFYGAADRFLHRRDFVVLEVNAIGTAYLRLDLLDRQAQEELRPLFRSYVQSRIDLYKNISAGDDAVSAGLKESANLQQKIWEVAAHSSSRAASPAVMSLVLPPINEMIDITTTRLAATRTHPPLIIYALLVSFALASALIAGYSMAIGKKRHWFHLLLFAFCIAGTIYVILDMEYPRRGNIRVDAIDLHLEELLESMRLK